MTEIEKKQSAQPGQKTDKPKSSQPPASSPTPTPSPMPAPAPATSDIPRAARPEANKEVSSEPALEKRPAATKPEPVAMDLAKEIESGQDEEIKKPVAKEEKKEALSPDKKILEGDALPHQKSDIRPENIMEVEQELPEEIITEEDKRAVVDLLPGQMASQKEKRREDDFVPTPRLEHEIRQIHLKEQKQISALRQTPAFDSASPTPAAQAKPRIKPDLPSTDKVPFRAKFLDKLKKLRQQANQKRQENMEKNLAKIMDYAKKTQKITNDEVEKITGIGDKQATRYLNKLVKQGKLIKFGKKRNIFYKPAD